MNLNEEQPISVVYWGPNSCQHLLACLNEFDPQWTEIKCFFFWNLHITVLLPPSMHWNLLTMEVLMYAEQPTLDQSSVELEDNFDRPGYLVLALTMVLDGIFFLLYMFTWPRWIKCGCWYFWFSFTRTTQGRKWQWAICLLQFWVTKKPLWEAVARWSTVVQMTTSSSTTLTMVVLACLVSFIYYLSYTN